MKEDKTLIQGGRGFSEHIRTRAFNRAAFNLPLQAPAKGPTGDGLRFSAIDPGLIPPTRTFYVQTPASVTLHLRQWWRPGETAEQASAKKGPAFLFVHGLSGRTEWMSPLVQELMKKPLAGKFAFYGLDIPRIGQHPCGEGEVTDWGELVREIREAARFIRERHGGLIHPVALSLGGLLTSQAMAEDPAPFGAPAILAPAYRPHEDLVSVKAFRKALVRFVKDKICSRKEHEAIPFRQKGPAIHTRREEDGFSRLQLAIHKEKETAKDRVEKLTLLSYLKMLKFMYDFRTQTLPKFQHRIRLFATRTDDLVDTATIEAALKTLPAGRFNRLTIFDRAAHDLINDPVNPKIAEEIERMLGEQASLRKA